MALGKELFSCVAAHHLAAMIASCQAACAVLDGCLRCAGNLFGFGYRAMNKPYLHYFEIGAGGGVMRNFSVTIPDAVMMHDFAMTEGHVVFPDLPLIARPEARLPPCVTTACAKVGRADAMSKLAA